VPLTNSRLFELADQALTVPGVIGVVLGGSRARQAHTAESDTDVGLYYRQPLDVDRLDVLAKAVAGPTALVTATGGWGPWVDGGGWLKVDGEAVDWIYRDLDRVIAVWGEAQEGRYQFHQQTGHPLGFPDHAYAGELALGRILADPTGELAEWQARVRVYPTALADALISGLWEGDFLIAGARKAVTRGDSAYIAGCLFRLVGVCAHALHGAAGQWLINEKGAVAAAGRLPGAPAKFPQRVDAAFAAITNDPLRLTLAIDIAADLVLETTEACAMMLR
jgi:predicted nucleotidyltransferase